MSHIFYFYWKHTLRRENYTLWVSLATYYIMRCKVLDILKIQMLINEKVWRYFWPFLSTASLFRITYLKQLTNCLSSVSPFFFLSIMISLKSWIITPQLTKYFYFSYSNILFFQYCNRVRFRRRFGDRA